MAIHVYTFPNILAKVLATFRFKTDKIYHTELKFAKNASCLVFLIGLKFSLRSKILTLIIKNVQCTKFSYKHQEK